MKTLKNRLKTGLANCYLLQGDDVFLFDKAFSMIKKACDLQLEDFNYMRFDDDNYSIKSVLDACEVFPMVDEHKLVLVKNVTKVSESDKKLIASYLENSVSSTVLVIEDLYDKFPSLKKQAELVDCKRMERSLATAIVVAELSKNGKQISGEAISTLLDYSNGYLTSVMNELDKLIYYKPEEEMITKKTVELMVPQSLEFTVFELTEALGKKHADKAIKLVSAMEKDQGTISLIVNHFRRLFFISISDMDNLALANLLDVKEYAVMKAREQSKNFSKIQLKKIYALLEKVDFMIKSGKMLQNSALYYLVFSILYI